MKEVKDMFNGVKTFDDSDDLIESLLNNPEIRSFVMKNDLTNKIIVSNMNAFLSYNDDAHKNSDGIIESTMYPGFIPILSYSNGVVTIKYKPITKEESGSKIKSIKMADELLDANLEDYSCVTEERRLLYQYARTFINSFEDPKPMKGLYVHGVFNTGKTYLASAIGNELANKGFNVVMAYCPELLSYLKSPAGNDKFLEIVNELKYCDLLILDDFGVGYITPYIRDECFGVVLNYRKVQNKPVIFTSNFKLSRLCDTSLCKDGSEGERVKASKIVEKIKELANEFELKNEYKEFNKRDY